MKSMAAERGGARRRMAAAGALAALALGLGLAGCEDSDPVAPADSTITVSASPQTVVVPQNGQGTSQITATVRSKNGTRLPDQEVTFTTTAGSLVPEAETPLITDDTGQAECLLLTSTSATITARSGSITSAPTQVNTAPGDLAQFLLNVVPQVLTGCNDTLTLTAQVNTTSGDPVQGVIVVFDEVPPSTLFGNFDPGNQILTDVNGEAVVMWTPQASICAAECQQATADPNNPMAGICELVFTASDTVGTFESVPVEVNDSIP